MIRMGVDKRNIAAKSIRRMWETIRAIRPWMVRITIREPRKVHGIVDLDAEAIIDVMGKVGDTSLHVVAERGDVNTVIALLDRGASINQMDTVGYGYTPLHWAAARGHVDVVTTLLDRGADINAESGGPRQTPIYYALLGHHAEVARLLLGRGASVDAEGNQGTILLILAAQHGYVDIVSALLDRGVDVNAQDDMTFTALYCAVRGGYVDTVKLLLTRGANIHQENEFGETPIQLIIDGVREGKAGFLELIEWLKSKHPEQVMEWWVADNDNNA